MKNFNKLSKLERKEKRLFEERQKKKQSTRARCKECGLRVRGKNHEIGQAHIDRKLKLERF